MEGPVPDARSGRERRWTIWHPGEADSVDQDLPQTIEAFRALPWSVHAMAALVMLSGLTLWVCGRRVLKLLMVVVIALVGGWVGSMAAPMVSTGEAGLDPMALAVLGGMFAGAVVGLLIYRSAMAVACALLLAASAPIGTAAWLDATRESRPWAVTDADVSDEHVEAIRLEGEEGLRLAIETALEHLPETAGAEGAEGSSEDAGATEEEGAGAAVERFLSRAWNEIIDQWKGYPGQERLILAGAALAGLALGALLGLFVPGWAAGAVTAGFGAAVWLPAFVWLSTALDAPWREALRRPGIDWLFVWGAVSIAGMLIQWRGAVLGVFRPGWRRRTPSDE